MRLVYILLFFFTSINLGLTQLTNAAVLEFTGKNQELNDLTKRITKEFESALIKYSYFTVLNKREKDKLIAYLKDINYWIGPLLFRQYIAELKNKVQYTISL